MIKGIKKVLLVGESARTSNSYGRNMPYMRYKVLLSMPGGEMKSIEDVFTAEELKELSYWSSRSDKMAMTCWGTSQEFEAQISLGRFLGLVSKERWPEFSRECRDLIQVK